MAQRDNTSHWLLAAMASSPGTLSRCATTLPVRKPTRTTSTSTIGQHGNVDVQATYHVPLGADGGAWLGPAYPCSPPRPDQRSPKLRYCSRGPAGLRQPHGTHKQRISTQRSSIAHLFCPILFGVSISTAPCGLMKKRHCRIFYRFDS